MKFIQVTYRFEYNDAIEEILDKCQVRDFARYSMMEGKTCDGKHFGTQVFPGNLSIVQAVVSEDYLDVLFEMLNEFRNKKPAHRHIQAFVLPIEKSLGEANLFCSC